MTLTDHLAGLAIETPADAITPAARTAARTMTLDSLACALGAVDQPGVPETLDCFADWGGAAQAGVLFHDRRLPLPQAAFANSVLVHALDYDDLYQPASLHVCSVLFPVAFSTAERVGATMDEFLAAFTLGVEVACRLGRASSRRRRGVGWLPTSVEGIFGGVAAASRLLGLTATQCRHALGIAYAQASGNRQALMDMSLTKRLQPAFAARDAIWAVELARRGMTGPHRALEGQAGFFGLYHREDVPTVEELGGDDGVWQIERLSIKRYPVCGGSHPLMDAALALAQTHDLEPHQIDRVEISWGGSPENAVVGYEFELGDHPQVNAQFSAPYCVALALVRRDTGLARFTDDAIRTDREVLDFCGRVHRVARATVPDPVPTPPDIAPYAAQAHTVDIHLTDGAVLSDHRTPVEAFAPERNADGAGKLEEAAAFSQAIAPGEVARLRRCALEPGAAKTVGEFLPGPG